MKKKLMATLITVALILSLVCFSVQAVDADVKIAAGNVESTTVKDTLVQVPVSITAPNGLVVGRVDVKWDKTALQLVSITYTEGIGQNNGSPMEGPLENGEPTEGIINDGLYPVTFGDYLAGGEAPGQDWVVTEETLLFTLNFKVCEGAKAGNYPITLVGKGEDFLNNSIQEQSVSFTAGSVTLKKLNQTITVNNTMTATYGDTPKPLNATAQTALSYAVTNGSDVVNVDNDGNVTFLKAGNAIITVTAAATEQYEAASATVSVTVSAQTQTIAVNGTMTATYGDAPKPLNATAQTALSYAVTNGSDVVNVDNDGNVTFLKAGNAIITVTAAATEQYAATTATVTVNVSAADYTYTMSVDSNRIMVGSTLNKISVVPTGGEGVNGEVVSGTLTWYTDIECANVATDDVFANKGEVTLYWCFKATEVNYISADKTGSVTFIAVTKGDINCDGKVSMADSLIFFRAVADWDGYTEMMRCYDAADIDGDGDVNIADATYLARFLAGWDGYDL